jgi:hypothetical protein
MFASNSHFLAEFKIILHFVAYQQSATNGGLQKSSDSHLYCFCRLSRVVGVDFARRLSHTQQVADNSTPYTVRFLVSIQRIPRSKETYP